MNLRFDDPTWLWIGAAVALVLVVPALRWFSGMSSLRRWSAVLARVLLVAILAALIAGVTLRRESDRLAVIAVIDVSGSVRKFAPGLRVGGDSPANQPRSPFDAAKAFLLAAAGEQAVERKPDDLLGVVVFDGASAAVLAPAPFTPASLQTELESLTPIAMREGTDIGAALNLAMSLAPPERGGVRTRLLLISDGVQTSGAGSGANAAASARRGAGAGAGGGSGASRDNSAPTPSGGGTNLDVVQIARDLGLRAGFENAVSPSDENPPDQASTNTTTGTQQASKLPPAGAGGEGGRAVWGGVDVLPIEYDVKNEVVVESLDAPPRISARAIRDNPTSDATESDSADRTIQLRVVLHSASGARGVLNITDQGVAIDINGQAPGLARPISLLPGRHVEVVEVPISNERVHRYEAIFEPESAGADGSSAARVDTIAENNRARAFTLAAGRATVLIIDGLSSRDDPLASAPTNSASPTAAPPRSGSNSQLARTLEAAGFSVRSISPEAFKPDLLELQTVDAVLLQSVPADALDVDAQKALVAYVRDMGGGLAMIGGPDSFAPGGWKGSPIEPVLPVRLDLPEQLVTPAAATVIVLDMSGSMRRTVMGTTRSQMDIAAEGAARAIESIDKSDLVGVVAFSDETDVVVPLGPNTNPQRSAERVRAIGSDGGTIIGPALQIAWDQLKAVKADEKHVIVLTDGRSSDSDVLAGMCEQMRKDDIRTSTIAVGDQTDLSTLSEMASVGAGKFYRVIDPTLLPRIFIKAVRVVRSPMIRREAFAPVISAAGCPVAEEVLRAAQAGPPNPTSQNPLATTARTVPPLNALVLTQPRPDPGITYSMATPKGEPLLAYWNVGTGKVAAWTSDTEEWSAAWHPWPGYARMWSRLLTLIARPAADRGMNLRTQIIDDQLHIRLEALDTQGDGVGGGWGGRRRPDRRPPRARDGLSSLR